jgi:putative iron-regulated protein
MFRLLLIVLSWSTLVLMDDDLSARPPQLVVSPPAGLEDPPSMADVVRRHAEHAHVLHEDVARRARVLQIVVDDFLAAPAVESLAAARLAWIDARRAYGELEALRFRGDPLDAIEPLLNAWPVDESYIDAVIGDATSGIVHDTTNFPVLAGAVLEHANERGSETNVSVGWHAIEFLLWGQDLDPAGPGLRPHTDYVPDGRAPVARRREYLRTVVRLLVANLDGLAATWVPDADNWRRRFEAEPRRAVKAMLTGVAVLTAFELAGERLAVAYETRDQEQEHSCFSDTTGSDLRANVRGIRAVFDGGRGTSGPSLLDLVRAHDPALAQALARALSASEAAVAAIPEPFDQAFLGEDDAPGRRAMLLAIEALERQAELIVIAGRVLGYELPLRPGD